MGRLTRTQRKQRQVSRQLLQRIGSDLFTIGCICQAIGRQWRLWKRPKIKPIITAR